MDHHFARAKFSDISIANQLFEVLVRLWLVFPVTDMSVRFEFLNPRILVYFQLGYVFIQRVKVIISISIMSSSKSMDAQSFKSKFPNTRITVEVKKRNVV